MREGQRARERERIPSRLCTVGTKPNTGLEPTSHEVTARAEIKSQMLNRLSHPGPPESWYFNGSVFGFSDGKKGCDLGA